MLRHALLLAMLFVPVAVLADDLEKMQGEWKLVKHESSLPDLKSLAGQVVLEIKGDEWLLVVMDRRLLPPDKFKLDPSKSPKHIDMMSPMPRGTTVTTFLGIYEFKGDRLRVCTNSPSKSAVRPMDFTSQPNKQTLYEFERIKK